MRAAFKAGYQVVIHVIGGAQIAGTVKEPLEHYVTVDEEKPKRDQTLEVCVNYSTITHVYPKVEKPKVKKPKGFDYTQIKIPDA